eukprot:CAMPEP_0185272878 /NCGR_PEP_ID=MMETSP1359-20130426/48318_1 /TAXON_ID=552665 /ORGANISM="Bigelowiella longifila, Strain CCMP242" /LENGTH=236 /DNA_ID=CAMNT_0027865333 /DNA_START=8 /DNA_END=718 /DNA_ORIENTATION=+
MIRELPTILAKVIREEFGTTEFRDSVKKKMDANNDGKVDRQEFLSNFINAIAYLGNGPSIQSKVQTQVYAMAMRIMGSPDCINADRSNSDSKERGTNDIRRRIKEIEAIEQKLEAGIQMLMEDENESENESESDRSKEDDNQHQKEQKLGVCRSPKFQPFTGMSRTLGGEKIKSHQGDSGKGGGTYGEELKPLSAKKYARLQSNESNESNESVAEIGVGDVTSKTDEGECANGNSI